MNINTGSIIGTLSHQHYYIWKDYQYNVDATASAVQSLLSLFLADLFQWEKMRIPLA